jgi:trimethylamine:corrinoid methyltransferase-like protein
MDNGATVLGNVEITAKAVTLSVNSQGRATRGQAMLEAALGGLVRAPLLERQTVEQMMASTPPAVSQECRARLCRPTS